MPATSACQLLIDPPADGAWNMAVDETLLTAASESGLPTLRFYQWARPTLSLGYFQNYAERDTHTASQDLDIVRRLSGGGAIVHDHELTYSLFLPAAHRLAQDTQALYDAVHEAIIETLNEFLKASEYQAVPCQQSLNLAASDEPFLCFERRSMGDILLLRKKTNRMRKIVGSAQRRRRGVVMQHGSILLEQSLATPELAGIAEIAQTKISLDKLTSRLTDAFALKLALDLLPYELSKELTASAHQLHSAKYLDSTWTKRR